MSCFSFLSSLSDLFCCLPSHYVLDAFSMPNLNNCTWIMISHWNKSEWWHFINFSSNCLFNLLTCWDWILDAMAGWRWKLGWGAVRRIFECDIFQCLIGDGTTMMMMMTLCSQYAKQYLIMMSSMIMHKSQSSVLLMMN